MKDLSLFFLRNPLSSKTKRNLRISCHDAASTTTMDQTPSESTAETNRCKSPRTLEEMLLQLDMEEAAARRAKLDEYGELNRRMSCVNVDNVVGSVRADLARFSLDGRTSVRNYSYINLEGGRDRDGFYGRRIGEVNGERVVWCRPGVVARLMGLEVVPVPVRIGWKGRRGRHFGEGRRKELTRCELEKFRVGEFSGTTMMKEGGGGGGGGRGRKY